MNDTDLIETLLPHGAAMRFVRRILEQDDDILVCSASVPSASPFARAGRVASFVALEVAAQAAGLCGALGQRTAGDDSPPVQGFLVNVREAAFVAPVFEADRELIVRVEAEGIAPPLGTFRFVLEVDGRPFGRGRLSLFAGTTP